MFTKSVNASRHVKDVTLFCELLDGFIQEFSVQHVQIITYNAVNYLAIGTTHGQAPHSDMDSMSFQLHQSNT